MFAIPFAFWGVAATAALLLGWHPPAGLAGCVAGVMLVLRFAADLAARRRPVRRDPGLAHTPLVASYEGVYEGFA